MFTVYFDDLASGIRLVQFEWENIIYQIITL